MSDEAVLRRCNHAFIQERRTLLENLTCSFYNDIANNIRERKMDPPVPDEVALLYEQVCGVTNKDLLSVDFALFCRSFSDAYAGLLPTWNGTEADYPEPTVSYVQNTFSDRAYRIFSSNFERVSASYAPGFREVCEEVYTGRCPYGMLPVYSSQDGHLISFRKLMSKYDLKISFVADVDVNDDSVMRFALLQKGIGHKMARHSRYLELSLVLDGGQYGVFLSACEKLGAVILMMHSLPLTYSDDRCELILQFDMQKASWDALFFFLEGSHIRYDTVGMYDIISISY